MVLDAAAVRRWCRLAADALGRTRGEIDALNVFPVPDGDTGTNLHLTVLAAADAASGGPVEADAEPGDEDTDGNGDAGRETSRGRSRTAGDSRRRGSDRTADVD